MVEVRAYISSCKRAEEALTQAGATLKGEYAFRDHIYGLEGQEVDLSREYRRVRVYKKTNWVQKNVEAVWKSSNAKIKGEFDTVSEAVAFFGPQYRELFSFDRTGVEYSLNGSRLFVEDVEGLPNSVEVIAPSQKEVETLFQLVEATTILSDPIPRLIQIKLKRI